MPELQRPTVTLHYEDAGAGPTLIFLHGWCDSSDSWRDTIADLAGCYRCLAPDMRGHGLSGMPLDHAFSAEALTNDILALCAAAEVTAPVLIGHSYGGYLAAETARRFPTFARAIVVEDQQLELGGFVSQMRAIEPVIRGGDSHMAFRMQWFNSMVSERMPAESRALIGGLKESTPVDVALALWTALFEFSDPEMAERSRALVAALGHQPSLTIEAQPAPDYHASVAAAAPRAQTAIIESGHWIHLERPADFRATLRTFLNAL